MNGIETKLLEKVDMPLYDFSVYPEDGLERLEFFSVPVGVDGKTMADTNMYLANRLPSNQVVEVCEIGVLPWCSWADRRALLSHGFLELQVMDKLYFRAPLEQFLTGRSLRITLTLLSAQLFAVNLIWPLSNSPRVSADVRLGVFLDGILSRLLA